MCQALMDHLPFGSEPKRPRTEESQFKENEVEDQLPVQNVPQPEESTNFFEGQMHEVSTRSTETQVDVCEKSDKVVVTSVTTQVQVQRSNTDLVDTAVQTLQKRIDAFT